MEINQVILVHAQNAEKAKDIADEYLGTLAASGRFDYHSIESVTQYSEETIYCDAQIQRALVARKQALQASLEKAKNVSLSDAVAGYDPEQMIGRQISGGYNTVELYHARHVLDIISGNWNLDNFLYDATTDTTDITSFLARRESFPELQFVVNANIYLN